MTKVVVTIIAVVTDIVDLPEEFTTWDFESRLESVFYRCSLAADAAEYGLKDYPETESIKVIVTEIEGES